MGIVVKPEELRALTDGVKKFTSECTVIPSSSYAEIKKGIPVKPVRAYKQDKETKLITGPFSYMSKTFPGKVEKESLRPSSESFEGELRDLQIDIIDESKVYLEETNCVNLECYPGIGKTLMSVYLWTLTNSPKLIILISLKPLIMSWYNTVKQFFPKIKVSVFGEKKALQDPNPDVMILMEGRTSSFFEKNLDFVSKKYSLIIDESHLFCTQKRILTLLSFTPQYIISCSATLDKVDGTHKLMYMIAGENSVFRSADIHHKFIQFDTKIRFKTPLNSKAESDFVALQKLVSESEQRNLLIRKITEECVKSGRKLIVLGRLVDHIKQLKEDFDLNNSEVKTGILVESLNEYVEGRVLYGTLSKISTGFDEAACAGTNFSGEKSSIVFFINTVKNWTTYEQSKGRGMRAENPIIIMLKDNNEIMKKHISKNKSHRISTNSQEVSIDSIEDLPHHLV